MKNITLAVPEEVDELDVKLLVASILFEKGILSSGQSAEMVGLSRQEFLTKVSKYGVSIFGESVEDLDKLKMLKL